MIDSGVGGVVSTAVVVVDGVDVDVVRLVDVVLVRIGRQVRQQS